jgi:hypothetical protein
MSKRILFVLTSHDDLGGVRKTGFYVPEAAHAWKVFAAQGYEVDFVSPKGGQSPTDGFKADDPDQIAFLEHPGVKSKLAQTLRPDQVEVARYDAICNASPPAFTRLVAWSAPSVTAPPDW